MLGLKLRAEFLSSQMPGTMINLDEVVSTGKPDDILTITYPTADVRKALTVVAATDSVQGRPVVVIGERGQGKSHILSVLHFAFKEPKRVQEMAAAWAGWVGDDSLAEHMFPEGFTPISVVMSNQEYLTLWDVLFKNLKNGQFYSGKFQANGTPVPSRSLMEEAFAHEPTALIIDELQTWYETLTGDLKGGGQRDLAFNFIQILSEIASSRPDLLRLVVSVRNSDTDAFRQVHRNNPLLVDFKGVSAKQDRIRLIQHRLFENYRQVSPAAVESAVAPYADERVRLLDPGVVGPARDALRKEVADCWPFAPELLNVVEDEILMSAAAQETRDLMRILVRMYKARGGVVPLITVADIDISSEEAGAKDLAGMVDTITGSGSKRLRDVALRNLEAVRSQQLELPHDGAIISALWVRSLSPGPRPGATSRQIHLDVTHGKSIDDNEFDDELAKLKSASFNIHEVGERLVFKLEENPRAKLLASARNDRQFDAGQDLAYIQRTIGHTLNPIDTPTTVVSRLIVLGPLWESQPWIGKGPDELPASWREPIVVVIPESVPAGRLAAWLKTNVSERRNLVRFLMPGASRPNPYADKELREYARCAYLAEDWGKTDAQYRQLLPDFQKPLRDNLAKWFDRLAVLSQWDFQNPGNTRFTFDTISSGAQGVLTKVEDFINTSIFEADAFRQYVKAQAGKQRNAYEIITALIDPLPPVSRDETIIPFLGESALYERILQMVADGEIILNVGGTWYRREPSDTSPELALQRIRPRVYRTGTHLQEVMLALPSAASLQPQVPSSVPATTTTTYPLPTQGGGQTVNEPSPTSVVPGPTQGMGTTTTPASQSAVKTLSSTGARAPVNLLGDLYNWQLPATSALKAVRLEAANLTPTQLKEILQRLPPTVQLKLEVDVVEVAK